MVDSGSNQSLIRKEFADKLGLVGKTKKMKMYVAGGEIRVEDSAEFDLKISPCYDEDIVFDVRAYSVKKPCQAKGSWPGVPAVGPIRIDGTSFNPIQNRSPEFLGRWLSVG